MKNLTLNDLETAQLILMDFWQMDEDDQQLALETAAACIDFLIDKM